MSLTLTLGPMNSGKTTELLDEASRLNSIGLKALYVNHSLDTRSGTEVSTHNNILSYRENLPNITFIKVSKLKDLNVNSFHSILIDEGQFFDDLVESVAAFRTLGKYVHVGALIGDYQCRPIGRTLDLIPTCDNPAADVRFKTAYCLRCAQEDHVATVANYSYRLDPNEKGQFVVGGTTGKGAKYMAMCRVHYVRGQ